MRDNLKRALAAIGLLGAAFRVSAEVLVNGPLTYEFNIVPGNSYDGSIIINNPADDTQELKAYLVDYFFYSDGRVLYEEAGSLPRSNADWIDLSPRQTAIPPKGSVTIHYSIQVPSDRTLTGTYWSVLMIEPIAKGSPESSRPDPEKTSLTISEIFRYAIQIVTHVGETGTRQLKFNQLRLTFDNGKRSLVADVENTGERWLRGNFWIDLYDAKGSYLGKFDGGKQRMYPMTSARFTTDLVGVANGAYKALIVVDCGGDDVFGVNVNLTLKD